MTIKYDKWREITTSAVTSLSTAVSSATSTGFDDVAQAGVGVQYLVVNVFVPSMPDAAISKSFLNEFDKKLALFEEKIESAGDDEARTHAFRCKQDHDDCMAKAKSRTDRNVWRMVLTACIGHGFTDFVKLGGEGE